MRNEKTPSLSKLNTNPFKRPFSHHVSAREDKTRGSGPGKEGVPGTTADLLSKHLGGVGVKKERAGDAAEKKHAKASSKSKAGEGEEEGEQKQRGLNLLVQRIQRLDERQTEHLLQLLD